jgi:hypothetical protein
MLFVIWQAIVLAQFDWLLTGQDFPVRNFYCPVRKTITKKLQNSMKCYLLKYKVLKWATRSIVRARFITSAEGENEGYKTVCQFNEVQYDNLVYSGMSSQLNLKRTYAISSDCSGCTGKYQTSVLLYYLAIARSIQQDLSLIFSHTALTLSQ